MIEQIKPDKVDFSSHHVDGYFTKRIMCRKEVPRDVNIIGEIGKMFYNHVKQKFKIGNNGAEEIIKNYAYNLTITLVNQDNNLFSRVLFKRQRIKPYSKVIGFAMGSFDNLLKIATLNILYVEPEYKSDELENVLIDSFSFWAKNKDAKNFLIDRLSDEDGIVSQVMEIKNVNTISRG